jgi:hypothetical protein
LTAHTNTIILYRELTEIFSEIHTKHINTLYRRNVEKVSKIFYSPTNAQVIVLKKKNYIKIYIKIVPTCFGAVTPSSGSALFVLAKVTVVKILNYFRTV